MYEESVFGQIDRMLPFEYNNTEVLALRLERPIPEWRIQPPDNDIGLRIHADLRRYGGFLKDEMDLALSYLGPDLLESRDVFHVYLDIAKSEPEKAARCFRVADEMLQRAIFDARLARDIDPYQKIGMDIVSNTIDPFNPFPALLRMQNKLYFARQNYNKP